MKFCQNLPKKVEFFPKISEKNKILLKSEEKSRLFFQNFQEKMKFCQNLPKKVEFSPKISEKNKILSKFAEKDRVFFLNFWKKTEFFFKIFGKKPNFVKICRNK